MIYSFILKLFVELRFAPITFLSMMEKCGFLHGNIFGKHMNQQGVCGLSLSAFPYPQTTSTQGWIEREILAAPWHVIG